MHYILLIVTLQVLSLAFDLDFHENELIAMLILPVVVCSWIRDLDKLSYYSMLANLALLFSLVVIFYDEIYHLITTDPAYAAQIKETGLPAVKGAISVATFLGGAVYAFEGIGVVSFECKSREEK